MILYCSICDKRVEFHEELVTSKSGERYEAYVHRGQNHERMEDKACIDIVGGPQSAAIMEGMAKAGRAIGKAYSALKQKCEEKQGGKNA